MNANTQLAVFKALANPDRINIMELLATRPVSFSVLDIARHIGLSQSQTSQHLATLRRAGLIIAKRNGNTILNSVHPTVNWPVKVFK